MCIQSTVSLLSGCLKNGENVAVVLKDIGVLHIDGLTFQMKFYRDFLEKLSGKEKFRRALLKAPWLLDMVASRAAPVASLALSGCLVVFPEFQMEFVPKPPPGIYRKSSGSVPAEGKPKKEEALPPLVQEGKKVRFAGTPTFIKRLSSASVDAGEFRKIRSLLRKDSSTFSLLPAICAVPEGQKQPLTCQLQGQAGTKDQEDRGRAHCKGSTALLFGGSLCILEGCNEVTTPPPLLQAHQRDLKPKEIQHHGCLVCQSFSAAGDDQK